VLIDSSPTRRRIGLRAPVRRRRATTRHERHKETLSAYILLAGRRVIGARAAVIRLSPPSSKQASKLGIASLYMYFFGIGLIGNNSLSLP
jgi:hypothetical protein